MKLSLQSRSYIREMARQSSDERKNADLRLNQARLFCELYDIINEATTSLNSLAMGRWSVCYQGEDEEALGFKFRLNQSKRELYPHIMIRIEPFGTSSIEVLSNSRGATISSDHEEMDIFLRSTAYKRYFAPHSEGPHDLKTTIPSRQILSRDFGDYLIHLFDMMSPYLRHITTTRQNALQAA